MTPLEACLTVAERPRLRPYQEEGAEWLAGRQKALLLDEMGLGKTPQALSALPDHAPVLVVVPAVVKTSWWDEAHTWRPRYAAQILNGGGSFRWPEPGEMLITNYEVLPPCTRELTKRKKKGATADQITELERRAKSVGKPAPETIVIADEAHRLGKNKTIQTTRFRAMRTSVLRTGGRLWGLTGTPLLNRPKELWDLVTSMGLQKEFGPWPWYLQVFNAWNGPFGLQWSEPSEPGEPPNPPRPNLQMLIPALKRIAKRRLKRQVLPELPEKAYRTLRVELGHDLEKLCDAAVQELLRAGYDIMQASVEAVSVAGGTLRFETLSRARKALAAAKVETAVALVEMFEEQDEPLVVMSDHQGPVEAIGSRPGWAMIHGDVPSAERGRIVQRFQAGELRGVALSIRAGGIGITLTRAAHVLRIDRNWTPALNLQAEDRVHRFGQGQRVLITDLVADHALDRRVAEICQAKTELAAAIDRIADEPAREEMR